MNINAHEERKEGGDSNHLVTENMIYNFLRT